MTLTVNRRMMPVVRQPNYTDLTWDVPMDLLNVTVGNEMDDPLYSVTLKEYLQNLRSYISKPSSWKGNNKSLYCAEKDSHVVVSSQACFLPVPKNGECTFNVAIMNYQSTAQSPAVLAIVVTSNGTSAQLITNAGGFEGQKLYFNKNGQKASFVAQRLSDNRREKGMSQDAPISQKEREENMVMIIQVPLKQPHTNFFGGVMNLFSAPSQSYAMEKYTDELSFPPSFAKRSSKIKEKSDMEHAIIKVGESEGVFPDFQGLEIERDTRFPVRVTLQYYKATSNGVVNEANMYEVSTQLKESRKFGSAIGSLVVGDSSNRVTAPNTIKSAPWWEDYWLIHNSKYPHYNEAQAREKVFKNGRFVDSPLSEVEGRLPHILAPHNPQPNPNLIFPFPQPVQPNWNPFGGSEPTLE